MYKVSSSQDSSQFSVRMKKRLGPKLPVERTAKTDQTGLLPSSNVI